MDPRTPSPSPKETTLVHLSLPTLLAAYDRRVAAYKRLFLLTPKDVRQ